MTKQITRAFRGAWMDETIPENALRSRIRNEPHDIAEDAVIAEVARQSSLWKFEQARIDEDPEPSAWAKLVRKITMPDKPSTSDLMRIRRAMNKLPMNLLALMDAYTLRELSLGWRQLLDRAIEMEERADDVNLLRTMLGRFSTAKFTGKRGPKKDCGPALSAVTDAILLNSSVPEAQARALAADLLSICDVRVPMEKSQQIKKRKKKN